MGFYRQGQPSALDRAGVCAVVTRILCDDLGFEVRAADPFRIEHDCTNTSGHHFIASCGDVVCCHCGKVVWQ